MTDRYFLRYISNDNLLNLIGYNQDVRTVIDGGKQIYDSLYLKCILYLFSFTLFNKIKYLYVYFFYDSTDLFNVKLILFN